MVHSQAARDDAARSGLPDLDRGAVPRGLERRQAAADRQSSARRERASSTTAQPDATHCIQVVGADDRRRRVGHGRRARARASERIVHYIDGAARHRVRRNHATAAATSTATIPTRSPTACRSRSGYIALQSESHPIQFRRVELLEPRGLRARPDDERARGIMTHAWRRSLLLGGRRLAAAAPSRRVTSSTRSILTIAFLVEHIGYAKTLGQFLTRERRLHVRRRDRHAVRRCASSSRPTASTRITRRATGTHEPRLPRQRRASRR